MNETANVLPVAAQPQLRVNSDHLHGRQQLYLGLERRARLSLKDQLRRDKAKI